MPQYVLVAQQSERGSQRGSLVYKWRRIFPGETFKTREEAEAFKKRERPQADRGGAEIVTVSEAERRVNQVTVTEGPTDEPRPDREEALAKQRALNEANKKIREAKTEAEKKKAQSEREEISRTNLRQVRDIRNRARASPSALPAQELIRREDVASDIFERQGRTAVASEKRIDVIRQKGFADKTDRAFVRDVSPAFKDALGRETTTVKTTSRDEFASSLFSKQGYDVTSRGDGLSAVKDNTQILTSGGSILVAKGPINDRSDLGISPEFKDRLGTAERKGPLSIALSRSKNFIERQDRRFSLRERLKKTKAYQVRQELLDTTKEYAIKEDKKILQFRLGARQKIEGAILDTPVSTAISAGTLYTGGAVFGIIGNLAIRSSRATRIFKGVSTGLGITYGITKTAEVAGSDNAYEVGQVVAPIPFEVGTFVAGARTPSAIRRSVQESRLKIKQFETERTNFQIEAFVAKEGAPVQTTLQGRVISQERLRFLSSRPEYIDRAEAQKLDIYNPDIEANLLRDVSLSGLSTARSGQTQLKSSKLKPEQEALTRLDESIPRVSGAETQLTLRESFFDRLPARRVYQIEPYVETEPRIFDPSPKSALGKLFASKRAQYGITTQEQSFRPLEGLRIRPEQRIRRPYEENRSRILPIERSEISFRFGPISASRSSSGIKAITTSELSRPIESIADLPVVRPDIRIRQNQRPRIGQGTTPRQRQRTDLVPGIPVITDLGFQRPTIPRRPGPRRPPPRRPPKNPPINLPDFDFRRKPRRSEGKRGRTNNPFDPKKVASLTAVAFNIRGNYPGLVTGLEVRPLPLKRRR